MTDELFELFQRNLPFIVRDENTAKMLLSDDKNHIIENRDINKRLIGVSVVHKNTIYLLCVDKEFRNQGLGTELLEASEKYVLDQGYDSIQVGAGEDYLMPGVPTNIKPYEERLCPDHIYPEVTNEACSFFDKRGYHHSWDNANCFDMRAELETISFPTIQIGDTIDGIHYRWATLDDLSKVIECTDDAEPQFSPYYQDKSLYEIGNQSVLVGICNGDVCATLIVNIETEGKGLGSVGCTTVAHAYRGKHIGVNLVLLGTKFLKDVGLKHAYLSYTYSGLDRMYGYSGYKICVYYYMASKKLI